MKQKSVDSEKDDRVQSINISEKEQVAINQNDATSKPKTVTLSATIVVFLVTLLADSLIFEWIGKPDFHFPIIFLFDAIGRIIICLPVLIFLKKKQTWRQNQSMHKALHSVFTWQNTWRVVFIRFGLQFGFLLGGKSFAFIGASTKTILQQSQVLLTAFFSYCILGATVTNHQIVYGLALTCGAIAFKVDSLALESTPDKNFLVGFIMMIISVVVCSCFFVLTERLLKDTFRNMHGWHKQFIIAVIDVPVEIVMIVIDILWEQNVMANEDATWDFFQHIDYPVFIAATNCVLQGFLMYFLFDWIDAVFVNLMFVLQMTLTWPLCLLIFPDNEQFSSQRLLILIVTILCCLGYNYESWINARKENSETKISTKKPVKSEY